MRERKLPLNVSVLVPTKERLSNLSEVKVPDIMDSTTKDLHAEGFYSVEIFGEQGSDLRDVRMAYMSLNVSVFNPIFLRTLFRLKGLYREIIEGRTSAVFDKSLKDFRRLNKNESFLDGNTGFHFFVTNFPNVKLQSTGSKLRDELIKFINNNREKAMMDKLVIFPAGLRELDQDRSGRPIEHELTKLYRRVLMAARTIGGRLKGMEDPMLDSPRWVIQKHVMAVDDFLEGMMAGDTGFIQAKWMSRRVFGSTRNVLSSQIGGSLDLDSKGLPDINTTHVGLYQFIKGALPKIRHKFYSTLGQQIYQDPDSDIELLDRKTYKLTYVKLGQKERDRWSTDDGFESVVNLLDDPVVRRKPIIIEGCYLALIYRDEESYMVVKDIESVPETMSRDDFKPITFAELFYLLAEGVSEEVRGFVTRYPITGPESIYATVPYIKTTMPSKQLKRRGTDGEVTDYYVTEMPVLADDVPFFDTMAVNPIKLIGLGGDHDGDTTSLMLVYSEESIAEVEKLLNDRIKYLKIGGGLVNRIAHDTANYVLNHYE